MGEVRPAGSFAATFAIAIISSVELYMSGTYWSDDETPSAPSRIAWSTESVIRSSSSGVARRSALPMT